MKGRHYDVIVLGQSMGALVAAALLARRDFSVLVLGQGVRPATYHLGARALRRRSFSLLGASSPALRRVLIELAQSQTFRRRTTTLDPMLSVLMPSRRFELPPDRSLFDREIEREFPEVRRVVEELYATLSGVNEAADLALSEELTLPPGGFWERRHAARALGALPFINDAAGADLLADFPQYHPYRAVVQGSVAFATDLAPGPKRMPPFAMARLHAAWTRGVSTLPGGEEELVQFLVDRISAHGGSVSLHERAERVLSSRSAVTGVVIEGDFSQTGCRFVLIDRPGEELAQLAGGEGVTTRASRDWPRLTPAVGRFITSFVVERRGLPEAMGAEALLLGQPPGAAADPRRPLVRLQWVDRADGSDESLLVAEALLPLRGPLPLAEARQAVLGTLMQYIPWLESHLLVVDSPHDGLPAWVYERGQRRDIDRIQLTGASIRPEPMEHQFQVDTPSFFGLCGEPVRGPIERTFLVGKTVLPALGQEGELLAACSAARLVTRSDPRREKMRLEMWNKVEIG
jgi:phytoene dehydrogenase-like protein